MAQMSANKDFHLKLKKFDMRRVKNTETCVFIGKRNTGKSFCVRDLLYYHKKIPVGVVMSGTEHVNPFFGKFIPSVFIHQGYSEKLLDNVLHRQAVAAKEQWKNKSCFIVIDDCLSEKNNINKCKAIKEIFFNGRHMGLFFILTMQYPLGLTPDLRTNLDYIFLFRENIAKNRKALYESYAGIFPTFACFEKTLSDVTENYGCLVIHNSGTSNKLEDTVFWYKAEDHGDYKMCHPDMWNLKSEEEKGQKHELRKERYSNIVIEKV